MKGIKPTPEEIRAKVEEWRLTWAVVEDKAHRQLREACDLIEQILPMYETCLAVVGEPKELFSMEFDPPLVIDE